VTLGWAVPIAALAAGHPVLGNWGFVLLGLAAGCSAYDRFFGYSAAWLRYMAAAVNLRAQLVDFQLAWLREMAAVGGRSPSSEEVQRMVEMVRTPEMRPSRG
jgi:conflict system pore-forming effector with SLATT domain